MNGIPSADDTERCGWAEAAMADGGEIAQSADDTEQPTCTDCGRELEPLPERYDHDWGCPDCNITWSDDDVWSTDNDHSGRVS